MRHLVLIALVLVPLTASAHDRGHRDRFDRCGDLRHVDDLTELYLDVLNSGSTEDFADIFTPDYVNHTPLGTVEGRESFAAMMESVYAAFPDIEYVVDDVVVEANRITYRYSWVGTHLGEFAGVPATGIVVHGDGMEIDVVANGRFAETWNYANIFGILAQIGGL